MEIQIHHIGNQNGSAMFEVIRGMDMKRTAAVALPDPAHFPVEGHPVKHFLPELRWYLEDYLQTPFGVFPEMAECVAKTMQAWGSEIFDKLFTGYARDWYQDEKRQNFKGFRIKITSDSPEIMSWPWEALYSGDDGWLALRCCIERQLSGIGDPPPLPDTPPQNMIHILYIIPRPYGESDISYNVLANSLVEYISQNRLPVTVDVLRPPTFDQMRKVLYEHPGYYHIVHFDGHGGYGEVVNTSSGIIYAAPEGQLVFETDSGEPDPVDTRILAQLLAEYNIPFVVMNACRSGMIDGQAQDPFASVAAGLLKAGVRSVVAMGYSLYISGAKEFVPAFYERLLSTGNVSEAVRAGRGRMLQQSARDCIVGKLPLRDWVVPVLYQQMPSESAIFPKLWLEEKSDEEASTLPEDAKVDSDYGFIGRGRDIRKLERAMQCQPQTAILIHGQAGVGKTTLAKGFLYWLSRTGGLRGEVFWFNFQEIHSAEYVINQMLDKLVDTSALAMQPEEKQKILTRLLRENPCVLIWDNFESVSGIEGTEIHPQLGTEDRNILAKLLKELRGGSTKVMITSRSKEIWLPIQSCYRLPLEGLTGEDLWEYCNAVVRDLGLKVDRSNETYAAILDKLCGNPLAIRSILLRLQDCSAEQLLTDLESSFEGMEGDESTRRLQAAYAVFGSDLTKRYLSVLQLTGLHEYYVDANLIKAMSEVAGCPVEPDMVDSCYHILENAGFCTHIGENIYRLHPALRGYLLRQTHASEAVQKGFVNTMGILAELLVNMPLYQVGKIYQMNIANLYYAKQLAESQNMHKFALALIQSLAHYAMEMRRFEESGKLYETLREKAEFYSDWGTVATAFHQLGMIAEERRDLDVAENWYKKALEIEEKQGNVQIMANTYHHLGRIAFGRQDFNVAESLCEKALAIFEKQGNEPAAAGTCHQLGVIVQSRRDFQLAETWYKKALAIFEKQGNEDEMAGLYHQLGSLAYERQDFGAAEAWSKKSIAISENKGDEYGAAKTYHQMGMIAEEQKNLEAAEAWYKKSLAIKEKQGDEYGVALTYHQLGIIAQRRRDSETAEAWHKRALAIREKQGDRRGIALTYHQLGTVAQEQQDFSRAGSFYIKSIKILADINDTYTLMIAISNYARLLLMTTGAERSRLREAWSACMPQELTEILKEVEAEMNDVYGGI